MYTKTTMIHIQRYGSRRRRRREREREREGDMRVFYLQEASMARERERERFLAKRRYEDGRKGKLSDN